MEDITLFEWPIVTGCERLTPGCRNCPTYWNHKKNNEDYHPVFHAEELERPSKVAGKASCIVAPGSDLLHEAIRYSEVLRVVDVMRENPNISFEIGTKRVERLEAITFGWPDNVAIMIAVEESRYKWRLDSLRNVRAKTKVVMFGPMTGRVGEIDMTGIDAAAIVVEDWGPNPRQVEDKWIEEIYDQCKNQGVEMIEHRWLCKET